MLLDETARERYTSDTEQIGGAISASPDAGRAISNN